MGRVGRSLSHAELDAAVRSLFAVGGIYCELAGVVEADNRPRCTGEPTGEVMPWRAE